MGKEKGWKKALMRLVTVYYPDRINKVTYTDKYHVLCEEITKELTKRYNQLKLLFLVVDKVYSGLEICNPQTNTWKLLSH